MKPPVGTKGITEAKRLTKQGYPLAAIKHLWRANQPVLGLGEARDIVDEWRVTAVKTAPVKGR